MIIPVLLLLTPHPLKATEISLIPGSRSLRAYCPSSYKHSAPLLCTAVGDSFQLCPCHSRRVPEYRLTMVMGMNSCGALSLTSSGLIKALEQARTLRHFQSDKQTYAPLEWRGDVSMNCVCMYLLCSGFASSDSIWPFLQTAVICLLIWLVTFQVLEAENLTHTCLI